MSASSNAAIELDEARDLSGIDLVECELSFHKEAVEALVKALGFYMSFCGSTALTQETAREMHEMGQAAMAKAKELSPARDAGTRT